MNGDLLAKIDQPKNNKPRRSGVEWNEYEDKWLLLNMNETVAFLAKKLERSEEAIRARFKKLHDQVDRL